MNKSGRPWILAGIAVLLLAAACSPPSIVPTPSPVPTRSPTASAVPATPTLTPSPTNTPLPPDPDLALERAWAALSSRTYQQESVLNGTKKTTTYYAYNGKTKTEQNVLSDINTCQVDIANHAVLFLESEDLQLGERLYVLDDTGLLKPKSVEAWGSLCVPSVAVLGIPFADLRTSQFAYTGEETVKGELVFAYEMLLTEEQIALLPFEGEEVQSPVEGSVERSVENPRIVVTVRKNDQTLHSVIVYIDELRSKVDLRNIGWSEAITSHYRLTFSFSDWDSTQFEIPEYVDEKNTETQAFTSDFTFIYPKVDSIELDDEFTVTLYSPSGSSLVFDLDFPGWGVFFKEEKDCRSFYPRRVGDFQNIYGGTVWLDHYEFIPMDGFGLCKLIFNGADRIRVEYFFNHPTRVDHSRRPLMYRISVTQAEGEDPEIIFWDVIETIYFTDL